MTGCTAVFADFVDCADIRVLQGHPVARRLLTQGLESHEASQLGCLYEDLSLELKGF